MRFNSVEFLLFLLTAVLVLWTLRKSLRQFNIALLVFSYVFYAWWDYRFLLLIAFSSSVDFLVGYQLPKSKRKKLLLATSLSLNLGLLAFFKYYNFFVHSAKDLGEQLGFELNDVSLNIILPVGISFYTFQTLSYSIDVYRGRIKPEKDWLAFFNYVSFFPQLVAGPIERASSFLPQFKKPKPFNYNQALVGMRLILYGYFKKMVIADNIGTQVDLVYGDSTAYNGVTHFITSFLFFVQLYTDFSAYTDIARGLGKLLGFELMRNFKTPLYAKSIPEFWSRWHISLTTWFRDYLFIPLAKVNRNSKIWRFIATIILFLLIGLWHGANYTFLVFGLIHGILFLPRIMATEFKWLRKSIAAINNNSVLGTVAMLVNIVVVSLTVILFRADNITQAIEIYSAIFTNFQWSLASSVVAVLPIAAALLIYEWFAKDQDHPFQFGALNAFWRRGLYLAMILMILLFGYFGKEPFYYFQF